MTDGTGRRSLSLCLGGLRVAALAHPSYGAEQIRRRLTVIDDPGSRADALILLAETYQRQGLIRAATETLADAELHDAQLRPDSPRLLTALAVRADLAVVTAAPDALSKCGGYRDAAIQPTAEYSGRVLHAEALRAVASTTTAAAVRAAISSRCSSTGLWPTSESPSRCAAASTRWTPAAATAGRPRRPGRRQPYPAAYFNRTSTPRRLTISPAESSDTRLHTPHSPARMRPRAPKTPVSQLSRCTGRYQCCGELPDHLRAAKELLVLPHRP